MLSGTLSPFWAAGPPRVADIILLLFRTWGRVQPFPISPHLPSMSTDNRPVDLHWMSIRLVTDIFQQPAGPARDSWKSCSTCSDEPSLKVSSRLNRVRHRSHPVSRGSKNSQP